MNRDDSFLVTAGFVSLLLHAFIIFFVKFALPQAQKLFPTNQLEVVLVNQQTATAPAKSQVLAQANLDGGGNTDAPDKQISSPLPANNKQASPELEQVQAKQKQLEDQATQLMSQIKSQFKAMDSDKQAQADQSSGQTLDMNQLQQQARQLGGEAARIEKEYNEYQFKPRKAYLGVRALKGAEAIWYDNWRQRIEQVGTKIFPVDANGNKLYGKLQVSAEIGRNGELLSASIVKSSGNPQLDQAALRVLKMAGPFAPLPTTLKDSSGLPAQIMVVVRTWTFEQVLTTSAAN